MPPEDSASFAPREHQTPFALGEHPRSWGDLCGDVERLAAWIHSLPLSDGAPPGELMVACGDRYACAVILLAIWSKGRVAALPPNGRQDTVDALCAERRIRWVLHDGGGRGGLDVRAFLEGAPAARPGRITTFPGHFPSGQPLVCLYTSGSTGEHLPCQKTAGQLLGEARLLVDLFKLGPATRLLATVPPLHIYGLLFGVLVPLVGGGAFVRSTPHHGETIVAELTRWQANVLCSVPAHLRGLAAAARESLPPVQRIFSSGAALEAATATALRRPAVVEVLGSSETGGIAWAERGDIVAGGDARADPPPVWHPFPGITVDADGDGTMLLSSPFVDPPPGGGPYRGADRISLVGNGCFRLLGRADGIVKVGGTRVSLAEVERVLRDVPGVKEAAVISVAVASSRGHELWAVVAGENLTVPTLRAALLRRVEPIALPRRFRLVDALPRESNGKLVKARLRALFLSDHALASNQTLAGAPSVTANSGNDEAELALDVSSASPLSAFFRGHFRDFPVLPGVVQLNNLVLHAARQRWPALGRLERVLSLKFRSPIRPDDHLAVHLSRRDDTKVSFEIRRAAKIVSSGVLRFAPTGDSSATSGDRVPIGSGGGQTA